MKTIKLIYKYILVIILGGAGTVIADKTCSADLTFHEAVIDGKYQSKLSGQIDREVFPSPDGVEIYVNRAAAFRIAEENITVIIIRDAPSDPVLETAVKKWNEKHTNLKYPELANFEVIFRLKGAEAKKANAFAQLNSGKTFALKLRSHTISVPTFLGSFLEGNDFALAGVSESDIERIRKLMPLLVKDERKPRN